MNTAKICLLGGYGDVGLRLARLLHEHSDHRIVLAGRDGSRAAAAAREIGPRCDGLQLDARAADAAEQLSSMSLCTNLTEATPPALAATLIAAGTHFVDSSASPDYVSSLRAAIGGVSAPNATAVLEAGLAPGLTNLIADRLCREHPETRQVDVLIELGMGVHHGLAATEWTLRSLGRTYPVKLDGRWQRVCTAALTRTFDTDTGPVDAIGFAFSDQQSIARNNDLDAARTFLALDPSWMTRSLRWFSRSAPSTLIRHRASTLAHWTRRVPPVGPTGTRLVVEALDREGNYVAGDQLDGGPQAEITAAVLAEAAMALTRPGNSRGIRALASLLDDQSLRERPTFPPAAEPT